MKKIGIICMFISCLLLGGCQKQNNAQIQEIGVEDAIVKFEEKQSFVLLVTRKKCGYCEALLEYLHSTLDDHEVVINNAVMDDSSVDSLQKDVDALSKYVSRPDQTPHYYYIENGEVKDGKKGFTPAQPDRFWDWIERNNLEG